MVFNIPEDLLLYHTILERWKNHIIRYDYLSYWRSALSKWVRGDPPLVMEICCGELSSINVICGRKKIPYIGIPQQVGLGNEVCTFLRYILDYKLVLCFWLPTPCTAGCKLRHLVLPESEKHLEIWWIRIGEHHKIWEALKRVFQGKRTKAHALIGQEWPKGNELHSNFLYIKVCKEVGLVYQADVRRCCLDGIFKIWDMRSNSEEFSKLLHMEKYQCCKFRKVSVEETGYYSIQVADFFIKRIK